MTIEKRMAGSDDEKVPADRNAAERPPAAGDASLRPADLHSLIQSRREHGKAMNLRLQLLQAITEGAELGIFSVDTECRYTSFNRKHAGWMLELYGKKITAGEMLKEGVPLDKDLQKLLRMVKKALAGEHAGLSDYFGDTARGRRFFELSGYPVRSDTGVITGAAVITEDITARKQRERELAEREGQFRGLAEDSPDLLFRMSLPGMAYEYVNPSSIAFTGYKPEEFYRKPGFLYELVHPYAKDAFGKHLDILKKGEIPPAAEFRIVHRNGESRWWLLRTSLIRDSAGHPVACEGFAADITDRKNEQTVLTETKERFRTIVESADIGILLVDAKTHKITDANPRALGMIGAPRDEVIGSVCHRFFGPDEGETGPVADSGERIFASERILVAAGDMRVPVLRTVVPAVISGREMRIESFIDLSAQKKTEDALRESGERYRAFITGSSDGVFRLDADTIISVTLSAEEQIAMFTEHGYIAECNDAMARMNGYESAAEMTGMRISRLMDGRESGLTACMQQFIRDGYHIVDLETREHDRNGTPHWFANTMNGIVRDGSIVSVWGIRKDITDRKDAETVLRRREECCRDLVAHSADIICTLTLSGEIATLNQAVFSLLGYTPDQVTGRNVLEFLRPEIRQRMQEEAVRIRSGARSATFPEVEVQASNGSYIPFEVNIRIRPDGTGSEEIIGVAREISGRKNAEKALRDAGDRLQSILDAAPFGSVVCELRTNGDLVLVSGNRPADRILGTDCSSVAGKTLEEAFPALASGGIPDAFRKVARETIPFHSDAVEYRTAEAGGIYEVDAVPLIQNRIAVFFRDITDKRREDAELEQREARFRALIHNAPDIIQILDPERRLVFSSPAFMKILGHKEGSQTGREFLDLIHPDDRERVSSELSHVYNGTNPGIPTEYRILAADGKYLYVESAGISLLGVPGVDGIVISTHTVHERKLAEQAIRESEERFRLIFRHSGDAVYLFEITPHGMPGKIVDANDEAVRQSGYMREELVNKNLLDLYSRELSQRSRAIMMELLTQGESRFETEMIQKDGSILPVEIGARLAKLKTRTYVIAISRDISRKRREERMLRIANQKLQLMNVVAWHDIQNKITGSSGNVALSGDPVMDARLKGCIDREDEVLRIIDRQLRYTREYQEMGIHPPQWVNLPRLLRSIVSFKGIGSLKLDMDLRDLELFCDPVIEKVFSHLIENTQKHGKTATAIRVSCRETPGGITIFYEDNGIGIPAEKKKDLFVRGVGSETGISLFFVHDILEISDMGIRETGEPGKGARFEISVPRGLYRGEPEKV